MTQTNEAVLERLFADIWNGKGDATATADELVHESYHIHDRDIAGELQGPELYLALAEGTRAAVPDMSFTIEDTVVDGDEVACRWTMTGTHEGELFGVEPTGRTVEMSAIEINRFEDGLLVETWTRSDQLGLMEQVGALPGSE